MYSDLPCIRVRVHMYMVYMYIYMYVTVSEKTNDLAPMQIVQYGPKVLGLYP